jgi:hypothetical protein
VFVKVPFQPPESVYYTTGTCVHRRHVHQEIPSARLDYTIPTCGDWGLLLLGFHYGDYRLQLNAEDVKDPLSLVLRFGVVNKQRSKLGRSNGEQMARVETERCLECWSSKIKWEMTSKQSWHRSNPRGQRYHVARLTSAL